MKIGIKRVGQPFEIIETNEKYRSDCARKLIGCKYDEGVWLDSVRTFSLMVDEEGLRKELPTNFLMAMTNPYFPIQKMVGDVVFVRTKPVQSFYEEIWDYEIEDLTQMDVEIIRRILDSDLQKRLNEQFEDYDKGSVVVTST